ncbi:hypothetical protein FRC04_006803 [Tulasnella sp. 424]|nr:hypothetical protein FRC04_006803 [Tulasnella sp. 424]
MAACVERAAEWCRITGIPTLSIYDENGILKLHHQAIAASLPNCTPSSTLAHPIQGNASSANSFPLTPPPSDGETSSSSDSASVSASATLNRNPVISYSISPSVSPSSPSYQPPPSSLRQRNPPNLDAQPSLPGLQLHVLCRDQSKPALVQTAQQLSFQRSANSPRLEVSEVNTILEGEYPPPDLLIIHPIYYPSSTLAVLSLLSEPMELHSFPPWQIRLTDIFYYPLPTRRFISFLLNRKSDARLIEEQDFRRALDQFATVDMKVGK